MKKDAKTEKAGRQGRARAHSAPKKSTEKSESPVIKSLVEAITQNDIDLVLAAWRRALKAKRRMWDVIKKKWIFEPDVRAQLEATKLITAYKEGLPVQRQVVLNADYADLGKDLKKLQASPESLRMMKSLIGAEMPALTDSLQSVSESNESSDSSAGAS